MNKNDEVLGFEDALVSLHELQKEARFVDHENNVVYISHSKADWLSKNRWFNASRYVAQLEID